MKKDWKQAVPEHFKHVHRHEFDADVPENERQAWMAETMEMMAELGVEVYAIKTENSYEFGFPSEGDFNDFMFLVFDDVEGDRNHEYTVNFENDEMHPKWMEAAKSTLDFYGIDYDAEIIGGKAVFKFDRNSDKAWFGELVTSGHIQAQAEFNQGWELMKERNQEMRERIERGFSSDPEKGIDPDLGSNPRPS